MPKLLKKPFFAFIASAVITFAVCFLAFVIFVEGKDFLTSKVFVASLLQDSAVIAPDVIARSNSDEAISNIDSSSKGEIASSPPWAGPRNDELTEAQKQELLDDIAEKLDIIKQQVRELAEREQNPDINKTNNKAENKIEEKKKEAEIKVELPKEPVLIKQENILHKRSGGGGGGSAAVVYPKILISEIQTRTVQDSKDEFVELYNPNGREVDLTGWYLQRKTAGSGSWLTFAPERLFLDKKIFANGYFLIAREGYYQGSGDIFVENPITEDNSFALKNPNGEISDKLGFGLAQDFELLPAQNPEAGKTIGRKVLEDGAEEETDVNLNDFEIQTPTPKAKNIKYVASEIVEPPPEPELEPEPKDTTPPEASFALPEIQNTLSFDVNFTITDILGTVTPSGLASYVFWSKEGEGEWQEDSKQEIVGSPSSYNSARNFTGENNKTYYFQVEATDMAGNISNWLPDIPVLTTVSAEDLKAIVINEIQTEGQTSKDEFVELYNPNNIDIDLAGYSLKKKTSGGNESNLASSGSFTGVIPALGYFLIAPQANEDGTENYTGGIAPDLRYSGKSYSVADNNTVLLFNKNGNLQDKVGFGSAGDFENAVAPNPPAGKSITRTAGQDTNDNSVDFIISETPTPKN